MFSSVNRRNFGHSISRIGMTRRRSFASNLRRPCTLVRDEDGNAESGNEGKHAKDVERRQGRLRDRERLRSWQPL